MPRIVLAIVTGLASLMLASSQPAFAQDAAGFQAYLTQLRAAALAEGVSAATLDRVLPTLTFSETAIRIDQKASGGGGSGAIPMFTGSDEQRAIIGKAGPGRDKYRELRPQLDQIERELGVPPGIILAIYGKESNFGSYTGNFDTISALATLAYEGRRRALFEGEAIAALKMVDRGVPRTKLTGSWAGAMGKPQFLPSVYLRLAVDEDRNGFADIWDSEADAMASIANYLVAAGWRADRPWGVAVDAPSGFDRSAYRNRTVPTRCPRVFERHSRWMTLAEWEQLGFRPQAGFWPQDKGRILATLLEPDGPGNTAYLLTGNYRAILDYNCSNFYAMGVGLLADQIQR
ncbi:lytic murein transglycosylase [Novosphingopyxis sp. YJ-S2-01]|uniref:lytic murein transglycosylase n=1 Tax=Novosphingopyxis sp. YJ-S2-01 TaxID=2794021 RepID=UPI0018DDB17D|nr:lytic murein transglycosylase [Novosphingopyxis sp. YJ-S2-01]MBH9538009.1 lytic murein transglycosylase [Novosphingopyxis sp. YJ-S2-01]